MSKNIKNFIKTDCGLSKYYLLKSKKGFFNTIRKNTLINSLRSVLFNPHKFITHNIKSISNLVNSQ